MEKRKVTILIAIATVVAVTAVAIGHLFMRQTAKPAVEPVPASSTEEQSSKTISPKQPGAASVPAGWKTYSGDLSQVSARLAGKTIAFDYPAEWGDVKMEQTFEGTAFEGPGEKTYQIVNLTFSSYPVDGDGFGAYIKIVDAKEYAVPNDIMFLRRVASSAGAVGDGDMNALQKLGHGYGSTVFFGVNLAKKYAIRNIESADGLSKGVSFFMDDGQAPGVGISFSPTLLNESAGVIYGGSFFLKASQLDQLGNELESMNWDDERVFERSIKEWNAKKDALLNGSYESDPGYMATVRNAELVMRSVSIR